LSKQKAIYPGTFDPLTNGHIDIILRSLKIFDTITLLLAKNSSKDSFFSLEERLTQAQLTIKKLKLEDKVIVDSFDGLLVDYCKKNKINIIIRGIRPLADFEYEFEMATANRNLNDEVETVFIITDQKYFYIRSSLIKDIARFGGSISDKVPDWISDAIHKKIKNEV